MPRYFFNVQKDSHAPDHIGADLPDLSSARVEAARLMGEQLREKPREFWNDEEWRIEVTDERGLILFTVYSSAIAAASVQP